MITNIECALDQMQQQALLEGGKRGKTEGKIEGKSEGKIEGKVEVARTALRKGFSVDDVTEITGLSKETVMELKRALDN